MSAGTLVTGAEVKSGLEIGQSAGVCNVKGIGGPYEGKMLCYR